MQTGTQLGRYTITSPLGKGGMGEVYRARDTRLDRDVALKILPADIAGGSVALKRFECEAKALAALSHPNILTVHDIGTDQGVLFVVTELLTGTTLRARIACSELSMREALQILSQVADGLSAAHSKGFIHRDLKPENIFITEEGRVKILDFGLAKLVKAEVLATQENVETESQVTKAGTVLGTVSYMSPEQIRGEPLDARSDLFSLGCVMYECVTGKQPFVGPNIPAIFLQIASTDPTPPHQINPQVPEQLNALIMDCLQKDPNLRCSSAAEVHTSLEALARGEVPTVAHFPSRRIFARHPRLQWKVIAAVLLFVIALGTALWYRTIRDQSADVSSTAAIHAIAVLPFVNMSGSKENEYLGDGIADEIIHNIAKNKTPQVVARSSAFSFKGKNLDVREIGKKLGVQAVLEGSIRVDHQRLHVSVQLIKTADGFNIWAEDFDRDASEILALQDEISRSVLAEINPTATPAQSSAPTTSLQAHDLYLRGRYAMQTWEKERLAEAEDHFTHAIDLDPQYGAAWASLAETTIMRHELHNVREREDAYARATEAARRALAVSAPARGEGHAALAHILAHEWKWEAAEEEAKRAITVNPSYPMAYEWHGYVLMAMGRFTEAEQEYRKGAELDPISPYFDSLLSYNQLGAGRYEEAVSSALRAEELGDLVYAPWNAVVANVQMKRFNEALEILERVTEQPELEFTVPILRANVYASAGREAEARALLSAIESQLPEHATYDHAEVAHAYAAMGDSRRAIEWLRCSKQYAGDSLIYYRFLPAFRAMESDPDYQAILREANFIE